MNKQTKEKLYEKSWQRYGTKVFTRAIKVFARLTYIICERSAAKYEGDIQECNNLVCKGIADAYIMLDQLKRYFGIGQVDAWINTELNELQNEISKDEREEVGL